MNFIDILMIKVLNYFDVKRRSARLEFNSTILIYSIVLIGFLMFTTDYHQMQGFMDFFAKNITIPMNNGNLSDAEAMELMNKLDYSFIPMKTLTFFPLLLLPLYIRRINDTLLHPAFIAPVVIVYLFDFLKVVFNFDFSFGLYNAMSFYSFMLVSVLCILPSEDKELNEEEFNK